MADNVNAEGVTADSKGTYNIVVRAKMAAKMQ
jgi:hypothetical protein